MFLKISYLWIYFLSRLFISMKHRTHDLMTFNKMTWPWVAVFQELKKKILRLLFYSKVWMVNDLNPLFFTEIFLLENIFFVFFHEQESLKLFEEQKLRLKNLSQTSHLNWKMSKAIRNSYETYLVYSIRLLGLWYKIKSWSGYFHMKENTVVN